MSNKLILHYNTFIFYCPIHHSLVVHKHRLQVMNKTWRLQSLQSFIGFNQRGIHEKHRQCRLEEERLPSNYQFA